MNIGFENDIFKIIDISENSFEDPLLVIYDKERKKISQWGRAWDINSLINQMTNSRIATSTQIIKNGKTYYEFD